MGLKILVADDSLTIQKVVNITLSSTDYEIDKALDEKSLFEKIENDRYKIVLLDFSLSDQTNGYELAAAIKEKSPGSNVIMMFGTFDSIDDLKLTEAQVLSHIVKPFESKLLIKTCETYLSQELDSNDIDVDLEVSSDHSKEQENLDILTTLGDGPDNDHWTVNSPDLSNETEGQEIEVQDEEIKIDGGLSLEMENWGMSVPNIIGKELSAKGESPMPAAISDELSIEESVELENTGDDFKIESSQFNLGLGAEEAGDNESFKASSTSLQSLDELSLDTSDEPSQEFEFDLAPEKETDDDNKFSLEKELEGELDAGNFWAADNTDDSSSSTFEVGEVVEFTDDLDIESEDNAFAPTQEEVVVSNTSDSELVELLFARIKPDLDKKIQDYIKTNIDQMAWDIIPDLAENVIKEEVRRISDSVIAQEDQP